VETAEVIKRRRTELDMTQEELANQVHVDKRQIRRYEAGETQPSLQVALAIANVLRITLDELAGVPSHRVSLAGDWWASWQTFKDGVEVVTAQEVRLSQRGELIGVRTTTRGISVEEGGYHWNGELRLWDNEILMGWYTANDGSVRSKGTMYFVLHPHGISMTGRWVGLSYDGAVVTGWGAMGKTEMEARNLIEQLKEPSVA
jgi:transcriptional regulator with XRE-family HTH domain